MNTFYEIYGVTTPAEAKAKLEEVKLKLNRPPMNLEEQALTSAGPVSLITAVPW